MAEQANKAEKTPPGFEFESMAVVLYCMLESGVNLGTRHYQLMATLSGNRSEHAFQHQFRKVKARAKELYDQHSKNKDGKITTPKKTAAKKSSPSKKRGKKAAAEFASDGEEEGAEVDQSPSKKLKPGHGFDGKDYV